MKENESRYGKEAQDQAKLIPMSPNPSQDAWARRTCQNDYEMNPVCLYI